jgi:hypothetical protein
VSPLHEGATAIARPNNIPSSSHRRKCTAPS